MWPNHSNLPLWTSLNISGLIYLLFISALQSIGPPHMFDHKYTGSAHFTQQFWYFIKEIDGTFDQTYERGIKLKIMLYTLFCTLENGLKVLKSCKVLINLYFLMFWCVTKRPSVMS